MRTDKRFRAHRSKALRSGAPLRGIGMVEHCTGHPSEQVRARREKLDR